MEPALCIEPNNYFECGHIWAPFVLGAFGKHHMIYTGLSSEPSQILCSATSTDPDLRRWERNPCNPIVPLEGFDWHWLNRHGHVENARDPHVVWVDDHYLLAYTGLHKNGCPVVGGMVSEDLLNWEDIGPILYRPMDDKAHWHPESCNIQEMPGWQWALMPSATPGITYYLSNDPHAWHGIEPVQIEYVDNEINQLVGIEVIRRNDEEQKWLVAFFEKDDHRLFFGVLDFSGDPWSVRRLIDVGELNAEFRIDGA